MLLDILTLFKIYYYANAILSGNEQSPHTMKQSNNLRLRPIDSHPLPYSNATSCSPVMVLQKPA